MHRLGCSGHDSYDNAFGVFSNCLDSDWLAERQELSEWHGAIWREDDEGVDVGVVQLPHHFAAATAGWENPAVQIDGHNQSDLGLMHLQHLRNRCVFGAEAEAGAEVETYAGVLPA